MNYEDYDMQLYGHIPTNYPSILEYPLDGFFHTFWQLQFMVFSCCNMWPNPVPPLYVETPYDYWQGLVEQFFKKRVA